MSESARCLCLRPLANQVCIFRSHVLHRISVYHETFDEAVGHCYPLVNARRSCCQCYFLTHVETQGLKLHIRDLTNADRDARPLNACNIIPDTDSQCTSKED